MVNDAVGDFIIRIKNAGLVNKPNIVVPYSKLLECIAKKMKEKELIGEIKEEKSDRKLTIKLSYNSDGTRRINEVKRISKPGLRQYVKSKDIKPIKQGHGLLFLSTPKGILTGDEARRGHTGGELLFSIW